MRAQIFLQSAPQQPGSLAVNEPQRRVSVEHGLVDPLVDFRLRLHVALTAHVELRLRALAAAAKRASPDAASGLGARGRAAAPLQLGFGHRHAHGTDRDQHIVAEIFGHDAFLIERWRRRPGRRHRSVRRAVPPGSRPRGAVKTEIARACHRSSGPSSSLWPRRHARPRASAALRSAPLEFGTEGPQRLGQPRFGAIGQLAPLALGRFGLAPRDFFERVQFERVRGRAVRARRRCASARAQARPARDRSRVRRPRAALRRVRSTAGSSCIARASGNASD